MNKDRSKIIKRKIRHRRVRAKVVGTNERPRLTVFRSNRHIYAQLIDDQNQKTLVQGGDLSFKKGKTRAQTGNKKDVGGKTDLSKNVGRAFGKVLLEKGFEKIVFDRGGYRYHGRVKALADGLKEAGIKF
ncbi:MAG: 50S ribosomal protein L18 [Candidatus Sungbacteria bacterium]|uniref:Large ribosomal subunit protein uL18 n=1 Tax=Candidatus Sungiibacteriota bacterium TaxID=2750080 RepID=A0A931YD03_9BACT|nr:50S ribosomal protein L18 [Candidatus Sungbacteria bacterium]MBI2465665.1 50S ribosomal protein L18 [Candidatus Sungbacteria bacterium]